MDVFGKMANNAKFSILWIYVEESFILHDSIERTTWTSRPLDITNGETLFLKMLKPDWI